VGLRKGPGHEEQSVGEEGEGGKEVEVVRPDVPPVLEHHQPGHRGRAPPAGARPRGSARALEGRGRGGDDHGAPIVIGSGRRIQRAGAESAFSSPLGVECILSAAAMTRHRTG